MVVIRLEKLAEIKPPLTTVLTFYLKWVSGHLEKSCIKKEKQKIQIHFVNWKSSQQFAHATALESTEFFVKKSFYYCLVWGMLNCPGHSLSNFIKKCMYVLEYVGCISAPERPKLWWVPSTRSYKWKGFAFIPEKTWRGSVLTSLYVPAAHYGMLAHTQKVKKNHSEINTVMHTVMCKWLAVAKP